MKKYIIRFPVNFYNCGGSHMVERSFDSLEEAESAKKEIDSIYLAREGTDQDIFDKYVNSDDGGYFNGLVRVFERTEKQLTDESELIRIMCSKL